MTPARLLAICGARVFLFSTFMTVAAVIPLITLDWALSATAAGAIVSSFTLCYALSVFGFGWAADHFGAKRMVMASALAAASASAAFGWLARDWGSAMLLYGLVGLAQGGVYTPLIMVLSDEVAPQKRGNAMGWLIASTSVGYAASLAIAGLGVA
ncbi:MAG: MFS transporter, partial [Burkholderiales bacterium]